MSSLERCLFKSFSHFFKNRLFLFLLLSFKCPLCIFEYLVFFFTKSGNLKPRIFDDNHAHASKNHVLLRFRVQFYKVTHRVSGNVFLDSFARLLTCHC